MKCIVTGKEYNSADGWGYSKEIRDKIKAGFTMLVGVDIENSEVNDKGDLTPENIVRTGSFAYIRTDILELVFNKIEDKEVLFVTDEVLDYLEKKI